MFDQLHEFTVRERKFGEAEPLELPAQVGRELIDV